MLADFERRHADKAESIGQVVIFPRGGDLRYVALILHYSQLKKGNNSGIDWFYLNLSILSKAMIKGVSRFVFNYHPSFYTMLNSIALTRLLVQFDYPVAIDML